ncbi:M20/M25/M40 family metallo-hydrolase [Myroides sp. LJL110]
MKINLGLSTVVKQGVLGLALISGSFSFAQSNDPIVQAIVKEATENSHLPEYAFELLDVIGPRLVGTPEMTQAHNWVVDKYTDMGIEARNEEYGTWKGWQRGPSVITLTSPRVKTLEATQLAWSPATKKKGVEAEVVILGDFANQAEFEAWLPSVKGKIVLISMEQPTGRPDYQWKEYATKESYDKMVAKKQEVAKNWSDRIKATGYTAKQLPGALEKAGAVGIVTSNWSGVVGTNKIFAAHTENIPAIDMALEDYGTLYRLAENGHKPTISINTQSKDLGTVPTFNTIAEFKGSEKADEYIILSAHLDSWDGGTGATDNGTGIITMMEAMRILKKVLPNPKRTIIVGNWGSEEQGLNGSRAFVEDHPELLDKIQVVFNQDNGTGRVANISGRGFLHSYQFLGDWLSAVPQEYKTDLKTEFPGTAIGGSSDHISFVSKDVPAFMLSSLGWGYGGYTWHTNRDTADKLVYDDLQNNAILIAIMVYKASEQDEQVNRERAILPFTKDGNRLEWPQSKSPKRTFDY